jgi:NADPH2:quinone reductase
MIPWARTRFPGSLDCLRPRGLWASFGQSSGPIEPFNIGILVAERIALRHAADAVHLYRQPRGTGIASAGALFDMVSRVAM